MSKPTFALPDPKPFQTRFPRTLAEAQYMGWPSWTPTVQPVQRRRNWWRLAALVLAVAWVLK